MVGTSLVGISVHFFIFSSRDRIWIFHLQDSFLGEE